MQLYPSLFTGMAPEQAGTAGNGVFAGVNSPKLTPYVVLFK
jgi:hypothetical protein